jgi:type I restriction enzyme S subunit
MEVTDIQYKESEIGVIPVDWEVKKLFEISGLATGNTPPTNDPTNYGDEFLFVSPADLGKGKWITQTEKKLSKKGFSISRKFPKNSILFTCIGSTIGKSGMAQLELTSNQQINAVIPSSKYSNEFIFYALDYISPRIKLLAGEQAVPIVNKTLFGETLLAIPPTTSEQTAIATALSDTDALIENLEKLIAKKRNIKQGVMQELLKPKPEWKKQKLGELLDYEQPTKYLVKDSEYNDNNLIPVLTAGKTFILGYTDEDFGIYENLPVIIFDDFTTATKFVTFPFKAKSSAMKMLKAKNKEVSLRLIYEIMQTVHFPLSDHKRYWISEYQNIEVKVPSPPEQEIISQILSDMDLDIDSLGEKLKKFKLVKQGMMQALLTGKIRLV